MADSAVPAQDLQFKVIHLASGQRCAEGLGQNGAPRRRHQMFQWQSQQLLLFVAHVLPAPVRVADQSGGVGHQDQALGVVQNLAGEVALALQLRLEVFQPADIQHQAAELRHPALGVAHCEGIDEYIHRRSVAAAERLLVVPHHAVLFHFAGEALMTLSRKVNLRADVNLQQVFPAAVAEHANQRVVDLDEAAVGRGEEQPFLNVVEQLPVTLFHLEAITDVLQHMDGLHALAAGAVHPRRGDQVSAFQHGVDIFVIALGRGAAERAGPKRRGSAHGQQGRHVDPDQRLRLHPNELRQRAVHAQNVAGFVVGHDEIADGIENLDPVPVGLVHAGEEPGIFQRHRGVSCNGLQNLVVFLGQPLFAVSQEQHAN